MYRCCINSIMIAPMREYYSSESAKLHIPRWEGAFRTHIWFTIWSTRSITTPSARQGEAWPGLALPSLDDAYASVGVAQPWREETLIFLHRVTTTTTTVMMIMTIVVDNNDVVVLLLGCATWCCCCCCCWLRFIDRYQETPPTTTTSRCRQVIIVMIMREVD